jgi:hypothetical protein
MVKIGKVKVNSKWSRLFVHKLFIMQVALVFTYYRYKTLSTVAGVGLLACCYFRINLKIMDLTYSR